MKNSNLNGVLKWLKNREYSTNQAYSIMRQYAKDKKLKYKKLFEVADLIQSDFDTFVEFYKKLKSFENPQSYEEWWQERNLDGSFAYNNITDDF